MPIINLSGNSELKKEEYVKELVSKFNAEYVRVYSDYTDRLEIIKEKVSNIGLFSKKTVIDVVDFEKFKASEKKEILSLLILDDVYLILRTQKKIKGISGEEFKLPNVWEEEKWKNLISEMLKEHGLKVKGEIIDFLFENVGPDEFALYNEIKKLKVFEKNLNLDILKDVIHKYTLSKLDDFCFAISEMKEESFRLLKDVVNDYEPIIIVYTLSSHFISLFRIFAYTKKKTSFSWPEISKLSKELKIPSPKVARFLGFKFKGQKFEPVNHLLIYSEEKLKDIIKRLYFIDRSVKSGGTTEVEILNLIKFIKEC